MRKSRQESAATRTRIVETAGTEFRRSGIAATGLNGLMNAAGLTHGGFYKHFDSKEQLVEEACGQAMRQVVDFVAAQVAGRPPEERFQAYVSLYLSAKHRDTPAEGCCFAALGSELARHGDGLQAITAEAFNHMADTLVGLASRSKSPLSRAKADAVVATLVGAMTLARAVGDPKLSGNILAHARDAIF